MTIGELSQDLKENWGKYVKLDLLSGKLKTYYKLSHRSPAECYEEIKKLMPLNH